MAGQREKNLGLWKVGQKGSLMVGQMELLKAGQREKNWVS